MPILKNQRHEAVAQAYVLDPHKVGWKAYKFVYPEASQRSAEVLFSQLLRNLEFSARVTELQGDVAATVEITLESLLQEAEDHRKLAINLDQLAAANGALKLKSELSGHYVQRKESTIKHAPIDYETDALITWLSQFEPRGERSEDEDSIEGKPDIVH